MIKKVITLIVHRTDNKWGERERDERLQGAERSQPFVTIDSSSLGTYIVMKNILKRRLFFVEGS